MDRHIVCFAIPSIEVALARLHDPALRTRPVAIAPLNVPRALLREVSQEAAHSGLRVGMPIEEATRVCPSLQVIPSNPSRVATANQSLLHVVSRYAPVWEPYQAGSIMMDVTGTSKLFGLACDVAATVQREVLARYQLEGVAGVGSNKLIAQTAATLLAPSELYDVCPGSEPMFMSPLSVRTLPGVHRPCMRTVLTRLDDLNLLTLGEVAESPLDALALAIGDAAGQLARWARGIDHAPVLPSAIQPGIEETVTLEPDEVDDGLLWGRLQNMLQRLCQTLRSQRRVCSGLALTLRYSDRIECAKRQRVTPETCWEIDLAPLLYALLHKCFRRRVRLRLMTVHLTGLTPFGEQGALFDVRSPDEQKRQDRAKNLAVALDRLHARFGEQAVRYGRTQ